MASSAEPDHLKIKFELRNTVTRIYENGNLEDLTVRRVREAAEDKLGLERGWFKAHPYWKNRSKELIEQEAEDQAEEVQKEVERATASPSVANSPVVQQAKDSAGKKRASAGTSSQPKKKAKTGFASEDSSPLSEQDSDVFAEPPKAVKPSRKTAKVKEPAKKAANKSTATASPVNKSTRTASKPQKSKSRSEAVVEDSNEEDSALSEPSEEPRKLAKSATPKKDTPKKDTMEKAEQSESEMSSLIDDEPPPKKRGKKEGSAKPKAATSRAKSVPVEDDPMDAEIKKLQDQLKQCGIRKIWGKERKKFGSSKAFRNHLREQLKDAGITGRFSAQQAAKIRQKRELEAELEAVNEFDEQWGMKKDDKPRTAMDRMKAKGFVIDSDSD